MVNRKKSQAETWTNIQIKRTDKAKFDAILKELERRLGMTMSITQVFGFIMEHSDAEDLLKRSLKKSE
tara:strand:- start:1739 stop:1942 length:204 start_codon:yes stop_codon:yes gene_type:complete